MDGILNINKPPGKTSFSIVSMVRRLSGERQVGHAGTLDPAASGVLPICLGQGTRVTEFLMETPKLYRAEIEFGVVTDTYDATGSIVIRRNASGVSQEKLLSALSSFCGLISQTPPMYSAIKYHGKPLYKLARLGIEVERKSRLTWIYHLALLDWQPPVATIEVECGKGTYIRSLAHDLGELLDCGGSLVNLTRLRYGPFDIGDTVSLPQLEDAFCYGYWQHLIYPIDYVLLHWAAVVVSDATEKHIKCGQPLVFTQDDSWPTFHSNRCRAYTREGCFLGVLRFNPETGQWQAEKVFTGS